VKTDTETVKLDVNAVKPKPATVKPTNDVLVTVNGVDITEGQREKLIKPYLDRLSMQAKNLPPALLEQLEQRKKLLRQQALSEMIKMQLLDEKVKQDNIVVTDQELTAKLIELASARKPAMSLEQFKKTTESYGYNFDELKNQVRRGLGHQKLLTNKFPDRLKVTVEDANEYYQQNKKAYNVPEQVRASHILIKPDLSDPNSDPNDAKALAREKTEDLLKQIKEGADFAALAKTHSADPGSAVKGGDLNFFPRGPMVAPFEKVAFELEIGKVSDVVETKYGYHIIKVTDRKDAGVTAFEQVKENIMNMLTQQRLIKLTIEYAEPLKAEAKIVYPPGKEPKPAAPPAPMLPGGTAPG